MRLIDIMIRSGLLIFIWWIGKFIHISDSRQSSRRTEAAFAWLRTTKLTVPCPSRLAFALSRELWGFLLGVVHPRPGNEIARA